MAHNPPRVQHPIPDDIRVFWISDYECWAGRSLEECVQASMKEFGVSREEAYEEGGDHEVPRDQWDEKCPNNEDEVIVYLPAPPRHRGPREIDWERTDWETLRETVATHDSFPALIGCRE